MFTCWLSDFYLFVPKNGIEPLLSIVSFVLKRRCLTSPISHFLLSILSYCSCPVAPPVFLPGSRPLCLYTFRRENSRLVFPLHYVVGYVAYCPTEHRLRKDPENGRSRFHPMKGTVSDLSESPTESFKGLRESGKDSFLSWSLARLSLLVSLMLALSALCMLSFTLLHSQSGFNFT